MSTRSRIQALLEISMHHKHSTSKSNRGTPAVRGLGPGLLGLAALLAPCLPAAAQPAATGPCNQIEAACRQAGFVRGAVGSGNGLIVDCIQPIMQDKPQPANASRPLPEVSPQLVAACKANNPGYGQGGAAPPSVRPAGTGTAADVEFQYNGDTYGWYEDGWNARAGTSSVMNSAAVLDLADARAGIIGVIAAATRTERRFASTVKGRTSRR